MEKIKSLGFPNYFGQQRFGRNDNNLSSAFSWIERGGKRINRNKQSIYFSSLRSLLFNAVLKERVLAQSWNILLDGDLANLSGSHSSFLVEDVSIEQARCSAFDIHPTGPLVGKTKRDVQAITKDLEGRILNEYPVIRDFLRSKMDANRRNLRVLPKDINWEWLTDDSLSLSFFLPAGSYATVLLEQVFELHNA